MTDTGATGGGSPERVHLACPHCPFEKSVPREKLPDRPGRIRCPKCGNSIPYVPPPPPSAAPEPPATPPGAPSPGGEGKGAPPPPPPVPEPSSAAGEDAPPSLPVVRPEPAGEDRYLVTCPHCGLGKSAPRERVPARARLSCPRCRNAFLVVKGEGGAPAPPAAPDLPVPPPAPSSVAPPSPEEAPRVAPPEEGAREQDEVDRAFADLLGPSSPPPAAAEEAPAPAPAPPPPPPEGAAPEAEGESGAKDDFLASLPSYEYTPPSTDEVGDGTEGAAAAAEAAPPPIGQEWEIGPERLSGEARESEAETGGDGALPPLFEDGAVLPSAPEFPSEGDRPGGKDEEIEEPPPLFAESPERYDEAPPSDDSAAPLSDLPLPPLGDDGAIHFAGTAEAAGQDEAVGAFPGEGPSLAAAGEEAPPATGPTEPGSALGDEEESVEEPPPLVGESVESYGDEEILVGAGQAPVDFEPPPPLEEEPAPPPPEVLPAAIGTAEGAGPAVGDAPPADPVREGAPVVSAPPSADAVAAELPAAGGGEEGGRGESAPPDRRAKGDLAKARRMAIRAEPRTQGTGSRGILVAAAAVAAALLLAGLLWLLPGREEAPLVLTFPPPAPLPAPDNGALPPGSLVITPSSEGYFPSAASPPAAPAAGTAGDNGAAR